MAFVSKEKAEQLAVQNMLTIQQHYMVLSAEDKAALKSWMAAEDARIKVSPFASVAKPMPMEYKLVAKSNYDRDYWDEYERNPCPRFTQKDEAQAHADYLNNQNGLHSEEFWVVKPADYQLKKGSDQL